MSQQPEIRIGDADREAAVASLGEHYAVGRLTKEEFDERAERAWAARTGSALTPLFADLPRPAAARRPGPWPGRGSPGWWAGAGMAPLLLVVFALVVLTHLPLFLLFLVGWLVLAKMGRQRGPGRGHGMVHPSRRRGPVR